MPDAQNESIAISFTPEEKRKLVQLAGITGQSMADYIRERVLAESRAEEEVIGFLLNELAAAAMSAVRAEIGQSAREDAGEPVDSPERQRDRIAKEVRASLSEFEQGLWPGTVQPKKEDGR